MANALRLGTELSLKYCPADSRRSDTVVSQNARYVSRYNTFAGWMRWLMSARQTQSIDRLTFRLAMSDDTRMLMQRYANVLTPADVVEAPSILGSARKIAEASASAATIGADAHRRASVRAAANSCMSCDCLSTACSCRGANRG